MRENLLKRKGLLLAGRDPAQLQLGPRDGVLEPPPTQKDRYQAALEKARAVDKRRQGFGPQHQATRRSKPTPLIQKSRKAVQLKAKQRAGATLKVRTKPVPSRDIQVSKKKAAEPDLAQVQVHPEPEENQDQGELQASTGCLLYTSDAADD